VDKAKRIHLIFKESGGYAGALSTLHSYIPVPIGKSQSDSIAKLKI